jgi:hypothetical protein
MTPFRQYRTVSLRHHGWVSSLIAGAVWDIYRSRWGDPHRTASFDREGRDIGVGKWNAEGVTIYATVGGSSYTDARSHRTEFFCGLSPAKDEVASPLAALALYGVDNNVVVGHGDTIPVGHPLWPGTRMSHFLVMRPVERFLDPLELPDGVHVVFMQAIPIYESELDRKRHVGADALMDEWEQHDVAFWSPDRAPSGC